MYLLLFLLFSFTADAQNYFDYSGKSQFLFPQNKMEVRLFYDLGDRSEDDFKLRVLSSSGTAKNFLNEDSSNSNDFWLTQSSLIDEFEIAISGNFVITDVWFQILDTKTHEIHETPKKKFVSFLIFKDYINRLNDNLLGGKMTE